MRKTIKVIIQDEDGNIRDSQYFDEFLRQPSIQQQMLMYGDTLLDILTQESQLSPSMGLNRVLTGNPHADASRMIGSIAESLVVKLCNESKEANRELGKWARGGTQTTATLDSYIAVATGSQKTKTSFRQWYNPSDTQKDVIWIKKDDTDHQLLCVKKRGSWASGKPAGLQVKASHDYKYVLSTIQNYHYPVLYFDLNNDWRDLARAMRSNGINNDLLHPDDIDGYLMNQLRGSFEIVVALINGDKSIQDVVDMVNWTGKNDHIISALHALDPSQESIILPFKNN
ncbi:hypothetical protein AAEH90_09270 [Shewanella algae]|uniref:hypothetical protein n=1 Tax=Shewanella algae TaxID=38313 RepID=UPI00313E3564